jgi:LysR family transcriptional regulator, low CO2-responsive transcriptional regulator
MLDSHQMKVFLVAAQTLNFTEAARRLNMSQPSVSQHIRSLERRFNHKLFSRRGRNIVLTDAGELLLPMARQMVDLSLQIEENMASVEGQVFGHLIIGCSTTAGRFLLPRLLATFRDDHPDVRVTCHVADQGTAIRLLLEGGVQMAVASGWQPLKDLEFRKFITDPIVLVAPPDHLWAQRGEIEPEELPRALYITREEGSGTRRAVAAALPSVGLNIDQLKTVMVLGFSEAIALSVQEGIGVAFIPRLAVQTAVARGDLAEVTVRGLNISQDIWLGRNLHLPASAAQSAFWDFVHHTDVRSLADRMTTDRSEAKAGLQPA